MKKVRSYLSLIKFAHTIFAMPFALIGFFLASRYDMPILLARPFDIYVHGNIIKELAPPLKFYLITFALVILCMVFARSAAMAFNRYLDRRWDALNPRTAIREIPKGIITPKNALIFTIINCILFITTTWLINRICFFLSPV